MEDGVTPPLLITEKDTTMIRVKEEVTKQLWLSAPLIGVSLLQYSLRVMFVGHLGSLPLSLCRLNRHLLCLCHGLHLPLGNIECIGDTLWPSVLSKAVWETRHSNAESNVCT